jgi:hypothetical protein
MERVMRRRGWWVARKYGGRKEQEQTEERGLEPWRESSEHYSRNGPVRDGQCQRQARTAYSVTVKSAQRRPHAIFISCLIFVWPRQTTRPPFPPQNNIY